jgi:putative membrane protein
VEERRLATHYLMRALILVGFSFFIVYLVKSDRLMYYIAPQMENYVKYAPIGLLVIAASQAYLALQSKNDKVTKCECEHVPQRSFWKNGLIYLMFIIPLLLGFVVPDTIMGSNIAKIKGINLTTAGAVKPSMNGKNEWPALASTSDDTENGFNSMVENITPTQDAKISDPSMNRSGQQDTNQSIGKEMASSDATADEEELKKLFPADEYTEEFARLGMKLYKKNVISIKEEGFMELLTAIDMYIDNFVGKTMQISGFVYREPDMPPNQFIVSRLAMQCCSADAFPYGILVESDQAKNYVNDTWVNITGTIGKTTYNENEIMKLDAEQIETIKAPETPYVYPYFEELEKLVD